MSTRESAAKRRRHCREGLFSAMRHGSPVWRAVSDNAWLVVVAYSRSNASSSVPSTRCV
jgi:hypothetical protein